MKKSVDELQRSQKAKMMKSECLPSADTGVRVLSDLLVGLLGSGVGGACGREDMSVSVRQKMTMLERGEERRHTVDLVTDVVGSVLDGLHFDWWLVVGLKVFEV